MPAGFHSEVIYLGGEELPAADNEESAILDFMPADVIDSYEAALPKEAGALPASPTTGHATSAHAHNDWAFSDSAEEDSLVVSAGNWTDSATTTVQRADLQLETICGAAEPHQLHALSPIRATSSEAAAAAATLWSVHDQICSSPVLSEIDVDTADDVEVETALPTTPLRRRKAGRPRLWYGSRGGKAPRYRREQQRPPSRIRKLCATPGCTKIDFHDGPHTFEENERATSSFGRKRNRQSLASGSASAAVTVVEGTHITAGRKSWNGVASSLGRLKRRSRNIPISLPKKCDHSAASIRPNQSSHRNGVTDDDIPPGFIYLEDANHTDIVGATVKVWWHGDKCAYEGKITKIDHTDRTYHIHYDDGANLWHKVKDFPISLVCPCKPVRKRSKLGGADTCTGSKSQRSKRTKLQSQVCRKSITRGQAGDPVRWRSGRVYLSPREVSGAALVSSDDRKAKDDGWNTIVTHDDLLTQCHSNRHGECGNMSSGGAGQCAESISSSDGCDSVSDSMHIDDTNRLGTDALSKFRRMAKFSADARVGNNTNEYNICRAPVAPLGSVVQNERVTSLQQKQTVSLCRILHGETIAGVSEVLNVSPSEIIDLNASRFATPMTPHTKLPAGMLVEVPDVAPEFYLLGIVTTGSSLTAQSRRPVENISYSESNLGSNICKCSRFPWTASISAGTCIAVTSALLTMASECTASRVSGVVQWISPEGIVVAHFPSLAREDRTQIFRGAEIMYLEVQLDQGLDSVRSRPSPPTSPSSVSQPV